MAAQEETEVKNASRPKAETQVSREGDLKKSLDSPTHPKKVSTQPRVGTRSNTGSPMWERKVSSEGNNNAAPSTPGRSRLRQVTLGDETPDDSTAVPVFGDWDDSDPASAEGYSHIFNKVREEKHSGGGKSPRITSDDSYFHSQRPEAKKGCGCFPWGRK
ncbi:RPM1-interacting protein 4-like [Cynara cardunculus var. scolymus]|uniref:RPM1-interacting protein 4-like n=1 Tax=Cynara cardunculus var. scolymus TaxID=59895 RepID=UPI000D63114D|nr:RPM1-interacting protein 4-like [Cynara cardunculus var. scolymus]